FPKFRRHVRRAEKPAGEIVVPRVVRTLDAIRESTFGLEADPCAAMAAHVEQRVDRPRVVARDDEAFACELAGEEVARVRNLVGAAGADPALKVKTVEFRLVELGIGVETARKSRVHWWLLAVQSAWHAAACTNH